MQRLTCVLDIVKSFGGNDEMMAEMIKKLFQMDDDIATNFTKNSIWLAEKGMEKRLFMMVADHTESLTLRHDEFVEYLRRFMNSCNGKLSWRSMIEYQLITYDLSSASWEDSETRSLIRALMTHNKDLIEIAIYETGLPAINKHWLFTGDLFDKYGITVDLNALDSYSMYMLEMGRSTLYSVVDDLIETGYGKETITMLIETEARSIVTMRGSAFRERHLVKERRYGR